MTMNWIKRTLVAALAVVTLSFLASPAHATFQLRVSVDGGANFSAPIQDNSGLDENVTPGVINFTIGGFLVTATTSGGTSGSISTLDLQIQSSGVDFTTGLLTPGNSLGIVVQASMNGLLTAPPPLTLINRFSDVTLPPGADALPQARTWIDQGNGLFVTSGGGIVLNTGNLNPSAPATTSFVFSANTQYSITSQLSTGAYAAGTSLGLDSNDRIVTPVPAGLLLALSGLPMLGLGTWLRRKRIAA